MVSMPKMPFSWSDDLNGVQVNPNPPQDAPVTVTNSSSLERATPPTVVPPMTRGDALDPAEYARMGERVRQFGADQSDPDGNTGLAGLGYWLGESLKFKRGSDLDAQSHGASPDYGNYVFGVYNAAGGTSLPFTLDLANLYGKHRSKYDPQNVTMDKTYTSIPVQNVQNITRGYNDYQSGTLRRLP
jgi:hypothetical protein